MLPTGPALDLHVPSFGGVEGASGAFLSDDRRYRYALWRLWDERPPALFIGLNPSTADEHANDRTIVRCINFARDWGHGGLLMANLYAWRATKPNALNAIGEPTGEWLKHDRIRRPLNRNDIIIRALAGAAATTVAAWGAWPGPIPHRPADVAELVPGDLHALATTQDGSPRHPLYVRADTTPERWTP